MTVIPQEIQPDLEELGQESATTAELLGHDASCGCMCHTDVTARCIGSDSQAVAGLVELVLIDPSCADHIYG